MWRTEALIASLAFHPFERVLLIAAYDEIVFWDWGRSVDGDGDNDEDDKGAVSNSGTAKPFARIKTANEERVRYVKFDALGNKLITGIANMGPHPPQVPAAAAAAAAPVIDDYRAPYERNRWVLQFSQPLKSKTLHLSFCSGFMYRRRRDMASPLVTASYRDRSTNGRSRNANANADEPEFSGPMEIADFIAARRARKKGLLTVTEWF